MAFDINPITPITPPQAAIFHLFPQLPTELRLKTWEHIFPPPRILKIRYNTSLNRYTTSTPSPITLSINHESREHTLHTYFQLLLTSLTSRHAPSTFSIPICFPIDTVYISDLAPILPNHMHDLLYNLSTCPARHKISRLAIDRRVWNELCDIGLLGVLCRMKNLQEVCMVVEFGRDFQGELTFLETPEWRGDLKWVAQRAEEELGEERKKFEVVRSRVGCAELKESKLVVKCVILMRGGEQA